MLKTCKRILWRWKYAAAFYVALAALLWWLLPPRPDEVLRIGKTFRDGPVVINNNRAETERALVECLLRAWSADGRVLAFATEDRILFWDLPNARALSCFEARLPNGWTIEVKSVRFDPLGRFALAEANKTRRVEAGDETTGSRLMLFDVATGLEIPAFANAVGADASGARFSPDGRFLAFRADPRHEEIVLWDLPNRRVHGRLLAEPGYAQDEAYVFDPTGRRLVHFRQNVGRIQIWDVQERKIIRDFPAPKRGEFHHLVHFRVRPDGETLEFIDGYKNGHVSGPLAQVIELALGNLPSPIGATPASYWRAHIRMREYVQYRLELPNVNALFHVAHLIDLRDGHSIRSQRIHWPADIAHGGTENFHEAFDGKLGDGSTRSQEALLLQARPEETEKRAEALPLDWDPPYPIEIVDPWTERALVRVKAVGLSELLDLEPADGGIRGVMHAVTISPALNYAAVDQEVFERPYWEGKPDWMGDLGARIEAMFNDRWNDNGEFIFLRRHNTTLHDIPNQPRTVHLPGRAFFGFSADGSRCITVKESKDCLRYEVWSLPLRAPWLLILTIPLAPILFVLAICWLWRRWRGRKATVVC